MISEQPSKSPETNVVRRHPATTAVILLAVLLLLLLPVHAYYFAFTRNAPPWLQWMLYGLLSLIALIGTISVLVTWRQSHPLLRWLDLLGALTLLIGFFWFMFYSHLRFQEKMSDSLFLTSMPWVLSKFLGKKRLAEKEGTP